MIKEITMQEALTALAEGKKVYCLDLDSLSLTELSQAFTGKLLMEGPDQGKPGETPKEIPKEKPKEKPSKKRNPVDTGKIGAPQKGGLVSGQDCRRNGSESANDIQLPKEDRTEIGAGKGGEMRIEQGGVVKSIYKHTTDLWCVETKKADTGTKGTTTYIGIKVKPRLKVGQKVSAGDEI